MTNQNIKKIIFDYLDQLDSFCVTNITKIINLVHEKYDCDFLDAEAIIMDWLDQHKTLV